MACVRGASQRNALFSTNVPPKKVPMPPISRTGPVYIIYMYVIYMFIIYVFIIYIYIYIYIYKADMTPYVSFLFSKNGSSILGFSWS